jgi:hypothetical protein
MSSFFIHSANIKRTKYLLEKHEEKSLNRKQLIELRNLLLLRVAVIGTDLAAQDKQEAQG